MTLPSCVFPGTCPNLSGPLTDYSTASRTWGKDQCKNWASCVHITMAQAPHGPGCLIQNLYACAHLSQPQAALSGSLALLYPGSWVQAAGVLDSGPDPACLSLAFPRQGRGSRATDTPEATPPGRCLFSQELGWGGALPPGAPGHKRLAAGSGHTAEPPEMWAPPPSPLGLCPALLPVKGCKSHTFPALLRDPGQQARNTAAAHPGKRGGRLQALGDWVLLAVTQLPSGRPELNPHLLPMKEPQERLWKRPDSSFHVSSLAPAFFPGA